MDTPKMEIGQVERKIDCNDFSEAVQINAVQYQPHEVDIFTKCRNNSGGSSSETDFVDHKHATDSYQEQKEEKPDAKNLNLEDSDHYKLFENSSTSDTVQLKNEEDIDIVYEDVKRVTDEEKSSKNFRFCDVCYESFGIETDIFKSTSYRFECSCQKQNDPLFYNLRGEDMTHDVKLTSLELTTGFGIVSLEVQDGTISGDVVAEEQDSLTVPQWNSGPPIKNYNKIKRKFCLKPPGNDFFVENQVIDSGKKKIQSKIRSKSSSRTNTSVVEVHEKPIHCKTCSRTFTTLSKLKNHWRIHTRENPFHCKFCSKSFSNSGALEVHERCHTGEKPFHCKMCSKSFSNNGALKVHERCHTGEKPFICKICIQVFSQSAHLKVHERRHTGEKPFHCNTCSKSFTSSSTLKSHEMSHTDKKPFHCSICSKSFRHGSTMKLHARTHTGEKPFCCKICSKSFSCSGNLKVHMRTHTDEKPFHCKICSKSYRHGHYLKIHERSHTGEKLFCCKICSKSFSYKKALKRHEELH